MLVERALVDVAQGSSPADRSSRELRRGERPHTNLIAAGKAAGHMAAAALRLLGDRIGRALIIAPDGQHATLDPFASGRVEFVAGGHPTPTRGSEDAGRRALAIARETPAEDELLVLLSGGASALMAVPSDGITLEDKRRVTDLLLRGGADIRELNTVRKHLSAIKGGQLAAASPSRCRTFAISDVVGDDVSAIGSGPTVADASTFDEALDVIRRFLAGEQPPAVVDHLTRGARGERAETPKPGDARLARSHCRVIGGRHDAMRGAALEAANRGFDPITIDFPIVGDVRDAAGAYAREIGSRVARRTRPLCVISSGETTVRVTGRGRGGRNQELALCLAPFVESSGPLAALASVGTDGVDGPTDAAGAIADSTTLERAGAAGLAGSGYLNDNNSYAFFATLGDLVLTGPTGTNVGDLQVFLLA